MAVFQYLNNTNLAQLTFDGMSTEVIELFVVLQITHEQLTFFRSFFAKLKYSEIFENDKFDYYRFLLLIIIVLSQRIEVSTFSK